MSANSPNNLPTNLYASSYAYGEKRLNKGFDYEQSNVIVKKTMMSRFFANDISKDFLQYVNDVLVNNINSVKLIRTFFNYTVKQNDTNVN